MATDVDVSFVVVSWYLDVIQLIASVLVVIILVVVVFFHTSSMTVAAMDRCTAETLAWMFPRNPSLGWGIDSSFSNS